MSVTISYSAREHLRDGSPFEVLALRPEDEADMHAALDQRQRSAWLPWSSRRYERRLDMLTTPGSRTSHIAVVGPRAGYAFRPASLQSCFGGAASLQASLTGAIAVVRCRAVEAEQRPRAPAPSEHLRPAGHQARSSQSLPERSWAGWCRERPAPAISDRNGCEWRPRDRDRRAQRADPETKHRQ